MEKVRYAIVVNEKPEDMIGRVYAGCTHNFRAGDIIEARGRIDPYRNNFTLLDPSDRRFTYQCLEWEEYIWIDEIEDEETRNEILLIAKLNPKLLKDYVHRLKRGA